ncbi:MAG: polyribonucleotide nucleotidyltransferase [Pontiellaceae bacterium]|nr:polyribonucleotide nucleotidyltransferase [Pontiellaceae bacterium]MBN2786342.1 polyribonucleotide nucleotidyltransferase [Pontiellaceae bacterium]
MKGTTKVEFEVGGQTMVFESGLLALQADGAVTCGVGENIVFSAVTSAKEAKEGVDFFPLQVEYREKFYAAGRFPGGYIKREARPSEKEILTMRVTDRPIRPLFPNGFFRDVQINNMLVSCDQKLDTDILSVNAASASLMISELPFMGPIGCVRIGRVNGEWVINPDHETLAASDLDLTYCGTREKAMMIEGSAKEISEADFVAAMQRAHEEVVKICDAQVELRKALGLPEKVVVAPVLETKYLDKARELVGEKFKELMKIVGKIERQDAVSALKEELKPQMVEIFGEEMSDNSFFHAFHDLEVETVRKNVIEGGARIGGRPFDKIRELSADVSVLPKLHGSSIFNRGETQTLCTVTLGTKKESQGLDAVTGGVSEKEFILHYNFPPYSVGEAGRLGMTSRREIGHGNLAERSIVPVLPDDFPYTIRVVSEIMGSNGSSSMATACGGCLALMDAGVPLKSPVAGISAGLFTDENGASIQVVDILGAEDHCGDMDFKVVGTRKGITGFQVDLKIAGLDWDQVKEAFEVTRKGRMEILDFMEGVIAAPREDLAASAPRITTVKIHPDKIGALIGPGGKHIRAITDGTGAQIDIEEDGTVNIFAVDAEAMQAAVREVNALTAEIEIGKTYDGKVIAVKDFGAFVECLPGKEGLVHISEMANERIASVGDICAPGDAMRVKCIDIDNQGRVRLSRKAALNDDAE